MCFNIHVASYFAEQKKRVKSCQGKRMEVSFKRSATGVDPWALYFQCILLNEFLLELGC